ncbi:hypothetical protein [Paraburkholderia sp. HP33-1]|uniref:hypothetical protein n=1 Tax=Paraburkholderia sp. HP33-1 TaxID=2883243 RepID=UPI001F15E017|nr:hypothetical protein [Paraburkholderia sp. HP33-1]
MYQSSIKHCRQDEWSELVLIVMKTSLSVAHELRLPPDAVLDCAARHLHFRDFPCFAWAMQGAARAHACCCGRDAIRPADVAYLKTLAAHHDINRNALACMPAMHTVGLQGHVGVPDQVYEKVEAAIQKLKDDVQRVFSPGSGVFSRADIEGAAGFAKALGAIMPAGDNPDAFERTFATVLHVRFSAQLHLVPGDTDHVLRVLGVDRLLTSGHLPSAPTGWMQRVKDAVHDHDRLHG